MRRTRFCLLLLLSCWLIGCHLNSKTGSILSGQVGDDNYVGKWLEIGGTDTVTIVKIHDGEYQIGQLTGVLKISEPNGQEYIYSNVQNSFEVQFIYDHTTTHLLMRSPVKNEEFKRLE